MFGLGHWELLLILLVILLVFGAKRIPEMAQGLGRGIREFRKAVHEVQDEVEAAKPDGRTLNSAAATDAPATPPAEAAPQPSQTAASSVEPAAKESPQG